MQNTIKELFNALYPEKELLADVKALEKKHDDNYLMERLSYALVDQYKNFINNICKDVSFKAFALGFTTATKLTAEAFVKNENTNETP